MPNIELTDTELDIALELLEREAADLADRAIRSDDRRCCRTAMPA